MGASATGVQIADELARAGREVVLAAGRHSRVPRRYRGMDIWWWLDRIGTFERTIDEMDDPTEARDEGALQLVGRADHRDVDLPALQRLGVRVTGRLTDADGDDLTFADDVQTTTSAADDRLRRLLMRIDHHIDASGLAREVLAADTPARLGSQEPITRLRARRDGIAAVVWATGYRRAYPWLRVPVLDARGEIVQRRGVTPAAGLYVVGQRHPAPTRLELHRRRSPRRLLRCPPHRRSSRPPPGRAHAETRGQRHDRALRSRRHRRRCARRRRGHRDAPRPRRSRRPRRRPQPLRGRHACRPMP